MADTPSANLRKLLLLRKQVVDYNYFSMDNFTRGSKINDKLAALEKDYCGNVTELDGMNIDGFYDESAYYDAKCRLILQINEVIRCVEQRFIDSLNSDLQVKVEKTFQVIQEAIIYLVDLEGFDLRGETLRQQLVPWSRTLSLKFEDCGLFDYSTKIEALANSSSNLAHGNGSYAHFESLFHQIKMDIAREPDTIFKDAKTVSQSHPIKNEPANALGSEADALSWLSEVLRRFDNFARQIAMDYRYEGKPPTPRKGFQIQDEYDVQHLLHSILKLHFADVRAEEPPPSFAGSSTRIDFLLKEERIVIEVKITGPNLKDKKLSKDLTVDIAHYRRHSDAKTLICFIYDPGRHLKNPQGLISDLESESTTDFKVRVVIAP